MNKLFKISSEERQQILEMHSSLKKSINEQSFDPKQDYLSKGYVDVTDGFNKDTYALEIPDGEYKCDGAAFSFKIVTNTNEDTGYVIVMNNGVRGMITGPITLSGNGLKLRLGQWAKWYSSLLYNEKLNTFKQKK